MNTDGHRLTKPSLTRLFAGIDVLKLGYKVAEHVTTLGAMHVVLKR